MWKHERIEYACGCDSTGFDWDSWEAGDFVLCAKHGDTTVKRKTRVYEATGSRNFQLSTEVAGESGAPVA